MTARNNEQLTVEEVWERLQSIDESIATTVAHRPLQNQEDEELLHDATISTTLPDGVERTQSHRWLREIGALSSKRRWWVRQLAMAQRRAGYPDPRASLVPAVKQVGLAR
jgi:hypothetical protein